MRPQVMPARFDEAVATIPGGARAGAGRERYVAWCEALAAAPGGATIDHNDLHDKNILPGPDGTARFYDWGDSVVAHPFASLLVALGVIVHGLGCAVDDPRIERVRDAYLEPFLDLAPHAELVATAELACRVAKVARALVWLRAEAAGEWSDAPLHSLLSVLDDRHL
jgi:hypothetical protein